MSSSITEVASASAQGSGTACHGVEVPAATLEQVLGFNPRTSRSPFVIPAEEPIHSEEEREQESRRLAADRTSQVAAFGGSLDWAMLRTLPHQELRAVACN